MFDDWNVLRWCTSSVCVRSGRFLINVCMYISRCLFCYSWIDNVCLLNILLFKHRLTPSVNFVMLWIAYTCHSNYHIRRALSSMQWLRLSSTAWCCNFTLSHAGYSERSGDKFWKIRRYCFWKHTCWFSALALYLKLIRVGVVVGRTCLSHVSYVCVLVWWSLVIMLVLYLRSWPSTCVFLMRMPSHVCVLVWASLVSWCLPCDREAFQTGHHQDRVWNPNMVPVKSWLAWRAVVGNGLYDFFEHIWEDLPFAYIS